MTEEFTETTSAVARASGLSVPTVRLYGDLGLLRFIVASNGTRLHPKGSGDQAAEHARKRLASRGRRVAGV
jgi:DNA-binding transcriptional MerR regulator